MRWETAPVARRTRHQACGRAPVARQGAVAGEHDVAQARQAAHGRRLGAHLLRQPPDLRAALRRTLCSQIFSCLVSCFSFLISRFYDYSRCHACAEGPMRQRASTSALLNTECAFSSSQGMCSPRQTPACQACSQPCTLDTGVWLHGAAYQRRQRCHGTTTQVQDLTL